tara:strand:- start:141 stop:1019 length:879 start_codon:yes stop_codon:yes gene_type:complete
MSMIINPYVFGGAAPPSSGWAQLGNTLAVSQGISNVGCLNTTRVAVLGNTSDNLQAYSWDGTDYASEGTALSTAAVGNDGRVEQLGTDAVFASPDGITWQKYSHNGTAFSSVDSSISFSTDSVGAGSTGTRFMPYRRSGESGIATWDLAATNWTRTGNINATAPNNFQRQANAVLNTTNNAERQVTWSNSDFTIRVFDFDGTDWVQTTGASTTHLLTSENRGFLVRLSNTEFAFFGQTTNLIRYFSMSGDVITAGSTLAIAGANQASICALNGYDISMYDGTAGLRTYRYTP